ncbi:MAG: 2-amino-4-hydroxy-6-hydroxymethyldihydropteridine diphosphokinase [bacterium]|nr:2-amino-4-hydroxy-6-hydroxymethyldihydropteridine diphosphokinase [bacterium]
MPQVFLALGSNIEPKQQYLERALKALAQRFPQGFSASHFYQSAPFGGLEQASYLNAACGFFTDLAAFDLLEYLLDLESRLGRVRTAMRWDERTLDLDIALYGDLVMQTDRLTLPHYDLTNRDFFLVPLLELDPKLQDPRSGLSLAQALAELDESKKTQLAKLE